MQAIVRYNNTEYTELDINNVVMTHHTCTCGNHMYVPLGAIQVGMVDTCSHCGTDYPEDNHCAAITEGWVGLIEDGGIVDLD